MLEDSALGQCFFERLAVGEQKNALILVEKQRCCKQHP